MTPTPPDYHQPVMLAECLDALVLRPEGTYVDATFGGGGHSRGILDRLGPGGRLFSFDQDDDARANAKLLTDSRFTFIEGNFRFLQKYLRLQGVKQVHGILADLGVSSHQLDEGARGFSTRFDGPLDMRMNQAAPLSAHTVLNTYDAPQLHRILGMYGEVKNARTLANALVSARANAPLDTAAQLKALAWNLAPRGREFKYLAQVFQAIRIEVNDELKALEEFLGQVPGLLTPGGRLVVLSFHSLEDRLVKNFIAKGKFEGELEKDLFGNVLRPLRPAFRQQPVEASPDEVARNNRARSAKLRVAEPDVST